MPSTNDPPGAVQGLIITLAQQRLLHASQQSNKWRVISHSSEVSNASFTLILLVMVYVKRVNFNVRQVEKTAM